MTVEIDHPPGEEIQWDSLELHETPWGEPAYLLLGALSYSGRFRGVSCEQMTFGRLAEAMQHLPVALDGTPRVWRTDRMARSVIVGTDRLTVDAAQAAKHYGVDIAVCPPRRAQRKGIVEAALLYTTKSYWRSARVTRIAEAPASLDRWCVEVADQRQRSDDTVAQIGASEPLRVLPPAAYPVIEVARKASRSALVAFEGNRYSVSPAHAGRTVTVVYRVGEPVLRVLSATRQIAAEHRRWRRRRRRPDDPQRAPHRAARAGGGLGVHDRPCVPRRVNRPPGDTASARLKGQTAQRSNVHQNGELHD